MANTTAPPEQAVRSTAGAGRAILGLVGVGAAAALLIAGGLTALSGTSPAAALGLPDAGPATTVGLPVVRALAEVAMVLTIGAVLLAAFLVPPQRSGYLDVAGYRALRWGSWSAAVWVAAATLMVPLSMSDVLGRPVADVLDPAVLGDLLVRLPGSLTWSLTALVALVVLVGCRTVLTWGWSAVLFGICLIGPLPVTATGHSAGSSSHDLAVDSLMLHVLAASVWVGGLVAVLVRAGRQDGDRATDVAVALPRFSRIALVCWLVLAVTGVLNALVRVPLPALVGSTYGALVLAKVAALLALGAFGVAHRRRSVPAAVRGESGALLRLGGGEVLLMLATLGLAVALARTPPPATDVALPTRTEAILGYDLSGPPTLDRLAFDWRFHLIFGTAALLLAAVYLLAVRRLRARGDGWPVGRTVTWLAGCAVLLVATSSGVGRYAPAMFSVHMAQHMMLGMLVPILLVLGGPLTLALRALPTAGRGRPPGPREWLLAAVHSPPARVLSHPLVALALFVGSFYVLYFSGLFPAALPEHWAHTLMNLHFLLVGALFFWPIVGIDPAPRRLPEPARLGLVLVSVPFHAFFGLAVMNGNRALGGDYYRSLALPWVPDVLRDQQLGGGLAWAAGEVPVLLVVLALLVQWSRNDERSARRGDRKADGDGDADRAAYNAMLRRLAGNGPPLGDDEAVSNGDRDHTTAARVEYTGAVAESAQRSPSDVVAGPEGIGDVPGGAEATASAVPLVARSDRDD